MPSRQDGAVVRRLILALPMPFREAIVLREFNGMSYREIAEVVSAPVETVMSRLARARAMLLWKAADSRTMAADKPARGTHQYASASRSSNQARICGNSGHAPSPLAPLGHAD
jgi:hypothetical protein